MKILTAIGLEKIIYKIKNEINCEIICNDILYEDGIFEFLEKDSDVDYIIINLEKIIIKNIEENTNKIKKINNKIKIIYLIKNKEKILELNLEEKIKEKNSLKFILINNYLFRNIKKEIEINNNNIFNNYFDEKISEKINEENSEKIYYENNSKNIKNKKINKMINIIFKNKKNNDNLKKENKNKIISICGVSGVGKSVFTASFAKIINKKILIIDLDFFNQSIHTLFGKKQEKNIKKINNKIDIISNNEIMRENNYKINIEKMIKKIQEIKNNYDYIFIDTSSEVFFDFTKKILEISDEIIFIIELNLMELNKSNNLLKIYRENWKINNSKIKIILNKINKNSIDEKIIKNIFYENKIIGKIKYTKKYNYLINKNMKIINNYYLKNIYKKILINI